MTIAAGEWPDILTVLHETHKIWSPGLSKEQYQHYIWRQINHPWGRRHFRFMVMKEGGKIVASCKLYQLQLSSRGRTYRVTGLGSVFTPEEFRSRGCATRMIDQVIELCRQERQDALMLYSDIGPEFYEHFGFIEFGSAEFVAYLNRGSEPFREEAATPFVPIELEHIESLSPVYERWQRRQPFAFVRSPLYWQYKLSRERFLSDYSSLSWPRLQLIACLGHRQTSLDGYAIVEQGGNTLRILEITGDREARLSLWETIVATVKRLGIRRLRGWEAVVRDLAPSFSLANVLPSLLMTGLLEAPLNYNERDWGRGMWLALNPEVSSWPDEFPCPLLELDHL